MTTSTTAVHSPDLASPRDTFSANVSLRLTARLPMVVEARTRNASSPVAAPTTAARSRVASAGPRPATNPAGSHATATRSSGCDPRRASSSSGRAPDTDGPCASR
jgi:hypothetical protein